MSRSPSEEAGRTSNNEGNKIGRFFPRPHSVKGFISKESTLVNGLFAQELAPANTPQRSRMTR